MLCPVVEYYYYGIICLCMANQNVIYSNIITYKCTSIYCVVNCEHSHHLHPFRLFIIILLLVDFALIKFMAFKLI